MLFRQSILALTTLTLSLCPTAMLALEFSDVPADSPYAQAVNYLQEKGILKGYADGTFKPTAYVNRAEAVKMIVAPLISEDELALYAEPSVFADISENAWFLPYVEAARQKLRSIDGPPAKVQFFGSNRVKQAEFLKMLFVSNGIHSASMFSDLDLPLGNDVLRTTDWFYPHMRFALASSMILVNPDGTLLPEKELTRGDIALLLHRFMTYREGRRTQALLSAAESDILNVLKMFEEKNIVQAELAADRAMVATRGALLTKPQDTLVKGAVKTSEGFRALVRAYQAGALGKFDEAVQLSSEAWQLAEKAKQFSPSLETVALQMQTIAKNMADEARSMKQEASQR